MNLNKAFLLGRLTQNPEVRTTPSGQLVCSFGLATNRVWNNSATNQKEEKAEFHNIVLWGKLAEIASQYLAKGSLALIEGRIQTRSWQDGSGNKRYKTEIVAENIQLGPKSSGPQNFRAQPPSPAKEENPAQQVMQKKEAPAAEDIPVIEDGQDEEIDVKDIPF